MLRFHLDPLESIEPWGTPDKPSLSWFALTQGWMVWPVGKQEIYRYREGVGQELGWEQDESVPAGFEDGVDYQLARPFQDIAECLPHWLEPVPEDVLERVGGAVHLDLVFRRYEELRDSEARESELEVAERGLNWSTHRSLDSGHLRAGPRVRACREGDHVRLLCDNRERSIDGIQVWAAEVVDEAIPIEEFESAMRAFGDALLKQMDDRLRRIEAGFRRPDVRLRPEALREQHGIEAQRWSEACDGRGRADWAAVREGLEVLDL